MKSHATITTNRIKLVISDSTLHVFWAPPGEEIAVYSGDKDHKDYITRAFDTSFQKLKPPARYRIFLFGTTKKK